MIPTKIHYCWFGKGAIPTSQLKYIENWERLMPEFEIKRWDESNFDVSVNSYVKNAYEQGKFAFVSDYARLKALYEEGGFYLDTDVELFKSLDAFCNYNLVSGIEYFKEFEKHKDVLDENFLPKKAGTIVPYMGFLSAIIGSEPGNELISDMIEFYDGLTPTDEEFKGVIIDGIMAVKAIKYGFVYKDVEQNLQNNMVMIPSTLFCSSGRSVTKRSYLQHHCAQSWQPKKEELKFGSFLNRLLLKRNNKTT
jgi:hypothetical protein